MTEFFKINTLDERSAVVCQNCVNMPTNEKIDDILCLSQNAEIGIQVMNEGVPGTWWQIAEDSWWREHLVQSEYREDSRGNPWRRG